MSRGAPATPAWWYGGAPVPWWARVLAPLYGALTALRRRAYANGWLRRGHPGVPLVVVGNIVAGGSGKTPLVIAMARRLSAQGWQVGIASRGHGRRDAAQPRWVQADSEPALVGDEPLLFARGTDARVRVDRDRLAAARALADAGCTLVLCDDGLQHYRLRRDIDIEVVDARRGYGNGQLMPAGPLREPVARADACDLRVRNLGVAEPAATADGAAWPMWLAVADARPLNGGASIALTKFAGQRVHAVAGIGDPERFFAMLREHGIDVVAHPFADHHAFVAGDLQFDPPLPVLMTEKDAVKCRDIAPPQTYVLPVDAQLPDGFWTALAARLPLPPPAAGAR